MTNWNRRHILTGMGIGLGAGMVNFSAGSAFAQSEGLPVSIYGRLPELANVALSPNAKRVAFVRNLGDQRILTDHDLATGESKDVRLGTTKLRSVFWADDEHIIVVSSDIHNLPGFAGGRNEYSMANIVNVRDGYIHQLFGRAEKAVSADSRMKAKGANFYPIIMGSLQPVVIDGVNHIAASNISFEGEGSMCLVAFRLTDARMKLLDESFDRVINWVMRPDGSLIARADHHFQSKDWSLRFIDGINVTRVYTENAPLDTPTLVGRGRGDDNVLVYFEAGPRGGNYYEVDRTGAFSEALAQGGDNVSPIFHPKTRKLVGFVEETPTKDNYTISDPVMKQLPAAIEGLYEGYDHWYIASRSHDPRKLIVYGDGLEDPGSFTFIDFTTGAHKVVGETRPRLPLEWLGEVSAITYKAADGLEVEAVLTMPPKPALRGKAAKNLPLVVLPHGGPQAHDSVGFDWWAQALASRGYVVLQPNYRGSDGYGKDFIEKGYGEWGRKMQTDLSDGVRHLTSQGLVDPKRVSITGASYGGYAAMAGVTLDPGVYNCSVAVAGVSNLKSMVDRTRNESGGSKTGGAFLYWNRFMGKDADWDAVSPDLHASKVTVPLLLIHGKDDDVVPINQSYRMRDAMQRAGKPVEFLELAGEDHWLSREGSRVQMLEASIAFLEKHNPPHI